MSDQRNEAYSAFVNVNRQLTQRRRVPSLVKDVPYLITKVQALAVHQEYGQGIQVHLRDAEKKHFFIILPNRIVQKVGVSSFNQFSEDIAAKQPPFLVFKGMDGNAFDIAIIPFSPEVVRLALDGKPLIAKEAPPEEDDFDWLNDVAGPSKSTAGCTPDADESDTSFIEDKAEEEPTPKKLKVEK